MNRTFISTNSNSMFSKSHLTSAFSGGIFGFLLFFLIIMIVKAISYWVGSTSLIKVDSEDLFLSIIGLVLMALINILEDLRLKEPLS